MFWLVLFIVGVVLFPVGVIGILTKGYEFLGETGTVITLTGLYAGSVSLVIGGLALLITRFITGSQ